MIIEQIELHQIRMKITERWQTSLGQAAQSRPSILITVSNNGVTGWGECVARKLPLYSAETVDTAWLTLTRFLIPAVLGKSLNHPSDLLMLPEYRIIRGHNMAKAALEGAIWDLYAKLQGLPLSKLIGGTKERIPVGVSLSIEHSIPKLLNNVANYIDQGYRRIKCKIMPGWSLEPLKKIRERFPDIELMVDANGSFNLVDVALFQELDQLNLSMIEQPFAPEKLTDHAYLQSHLATPICLDESISTIGYAKAALALKACRIINIKVSRMGGLTNVLQLHELCADTDIQLWCGGMFETGVGRYANAHIASLPNLTLANDIPPKGHSTHDEFAGPSFILNSEDSTINVPTGIGLGVEVHIDILKAARQRYECMTNSTPSVFINVYPASTQNKLEAISRKPLQPENHNQQIRAVFSPTTLSEEVVPDPTCPLDFEWQGALHTPFSQQAQSVPKNLAVVSSSWAITYEELERLSNRLAHYLVTHQASGKVVAIYADTTPTVIWAILGVLKAGAGYLILNAVVPDKRLRSYCKQTEPAVILHLEDAGALPDLLQTAAPVICTLPANPLDAEQLLADYPRSLPKVDITAEHLAYIVFTSGTTGVSKGIKGTHGSPVHFLNWHIATFQLNEKDRFSLLAGLAHDISLRDIFTPLFIGATLYIPDKGDILPGRLATWLEQKKITVSHLTPALGQIINMDNVPLTHLRYLFFGGDKLSQQLVEQLSRLALQVTCVNFYGTTETPQAMSYFVASKNDNSRSIVPIGKGINNVQLLIVKENQQLARVGEIGEILVRTPYLSAGYLHNEALTHERFITNPFTQSTKDRTYKTGDLGRYLPDGNVEILGRGDDQVNLQGYRLELGEVEAILNKHPHIQQSLVVAKNGERGNYLIAYIVSSLEVDQVELRALLASNILAYAIPRTIIRLDTFPLTENGKIDRRALPEPSIASNQFIPPQTATEKALASIWCELLSIEKVGINDNFFEIGGYSLLVFLFISRVQDALEITVPLHWIFEFPTLVELSEKVDSLKKRALPPIQSVVRGKPMPLSFGQERLWHRLQQAQNLPNYRVSYFCQLTGSLKVTALEQCITELERRHENLRTVFPKINGTPYQVILSPGRTSLQVVDLQGCSTQLQTSEIARRAAEISLTPFDVENDSLFRANLLKVGADEYIFMLVFHHLIMDGWSKRILLHELSQLYQAFSSKTAPTLSPVSLQYVDFANWQRQVWSGDIPDPHLNYWRPSLSGQLPIIALPYEKMPSSTSGEWEVNIKTIHLSHKHSEALKVISRKYGGTLFMTLLAAFKVLLFRITGQTDLIIGSPNAGRHRKELESMMGYFLNLMVIRTHLSNAASFPELIQRLRQTLLNAYADHAIPFEKLITELQPNHNLNEKPIFNVWFNMINMQNQSLNFPGVAVKPITFNLPVINLYDLAVVVRETTSADSDSGLQIKLVYKSELFKAYNMSDLLEQYKQLLQCIVEYPEVTVSQLNVLIKDMKKSEIEKAI